MLEPAFLQIAAAHFMAMLAPGPVLVGVSSVTLKNGMKSALIYILGVAAADSILIFFGMFGISQIVFAIKPIYIIFHIIGAIYFAYFGIKMIFYQSLNGDIKLQNKQVFISGFLTAFNPKALLFYTVLIVAFINSDITNFTKFLWSVWMIFATFLIFAGIAAIFNLYKNQVMKYIKYIDKLFGIFFLYFSIKLICEIVNF